MTFKFYVLFEDGAKHIVEARDTSEAWEKALDIPNPTKVLDVWIV